MKNVNSKLVSKMIKAVVNKNCTVPILEYVKLEKKILTFSDLETFVTIPYHTGIDGCIEAWDFLTAIELLPEPIFKVDDYAINISQGRKSMKFTGMNNEDYPLSVDPEHAQLNEIGVLTENDLHNVETALTFISKDDFRPAMTGIYFSDRIVSTDAHRMCWFPIEPMLENFILPKKVAKLLIMIGGEWQIFYNNNVENKLMFMNSDGIEIICRAIDANYPDFKAVIPTGRGNVLLNLDHAEFVSEIKTALKFSNSEVNNVILSVNGSVKVSAQDVDLGKEYTAVIEKWTCVKKNDLVIGFNGRFMLEILSKLDSKKKVILTMWEPSKAIIVNSNFLQIPLMLNSEI